MTDNTVREPASPPTLNVVPNGTATSEAAATAPEPVAALDDHLVNGKVAPIASDVRNGALGQLEARLEVGTEDGKDVNGLDGTEPIHLDSDYVLEEVESTRIVSEKIDATFRGRCIGPSAVPWSR